MLSPAVMYEWQIIKPADIQWLIFWHGHHDFYTYLAKHLSAPQVSVSSASRRLPLHSPAWCPCSRRWCWTHAGPSLARWESLQCVFSGGCSLLGYGTAVTPMPQGESVERKEWTQRKRSEKATTEQGGRERDWHPIRQPFNPLTPFS